MPPTRENASKEEPQPIEGPILFEESDFRALAPGLASNPDYNAHRLAARRRLLALGKRAASAAGPLGLELECRTSLHHPHTFNGNRVQRLWAYLTRTKKAKGALKKLLGPELGKDLDSAYATPTCASRSRVRASRSRCASTRTAGTTARTS